MSPAPSPAPSPPRRRFTSLPLCASRFALALAASPLVTALCGGEPDYLDSSSFPLLIYLLCVLQPDPCQRTCHEGCFSQSEALPQLPFHLCFLRGLCFRQQSQQRVWGLRVHRHIPPPSPEKRQRQKPLPGPVLAGGGE